MSTARTLLSGLRRRVQRTPAQRPVGLGFLDPLGVDRASFEREAASFSAGRGPALLAQAEARYAELTGRPSIGEVGPDVAERLYALVRVLRPAVAVETGVCNGASTLAVLLALADNQHGILHSVDLPYFAGDSLEAFRAKTFAGFGGAAVPKGLEPGWMVPQELRGRWRLHLGRSQRVLPEVLVQEGDIDLFVHDSEHSLACMLFEYEIAWARLRTGGVLVSHDIQKTPAFDAFSELRGAARHLLAPTTGLLVKPRQAAE